METKTYKLKDIAISVFDGVHNTVLDNENGDCFLLSAKNIKNGIISFDQTDRKIDKSTRDKLSKRTNLAKDDVLVTTVGTVGELAIVDENYQKYEFQRSVGIIKCNQEIVLPQYLYYLLKTESYNYYLHVVATGAAQLCIFLSTLKNIKIKLPNLHVQSDVVSVLSKYDKLINNYKKQIKDLQNLASELYKEWFVRFRFPGYEKASFENGIPVGWKYITLKELANVEMGQSPESCFYNRDKVGLPFHQGVGNYGALYLKDEVYSSEGTRIAKSGSIIFSVRAPVGKINITLNKIILGRGVAGINSKEGKNGFLLWSLKSKFSKEDLIGNGSIFASVTKVELLKQKILIPSRDILNEYDEFASDIEKRSRTLYLQVLNLSKQRDLLLPRLMSGKLEEK